MGREWAAGPVGIRDTLRSRTVVGAGGVVSWPGNDRTGISLKLEVVILAVVIREGEIFLTGDSLYRCPAWPSSYQPRTDQPRRARIRWILNVLCFRYVVQEGVKTPDILVKTSKHNKRAILGPIGCRFVLSAQVQQ
jgi:hypothetical protein